MSEDGKQVVLRCYERPDAVRPVREGTHRAAFAGIPSTGRRVRYGSLSFAASRADGSPSGAERAPRDLAEDVRAAPRGTPGAK